MDGARRVLDGVRRDAAMGLPGKGGTMPERDLGLRVSSYLYRPVILRFVQLRRKKTASAAGK